VAAGRVVVAPCALGELAAYKRPSVGAPLVPVSTTSVHPCKGRKSLPVHCFKRAVSWGLPGGERGRRSIKHKRTKRSDGRVRHVRILGIGIGLAAAVVMSMVGAGTALAFKEPALRWALLKNCPTANPEARKCTWGATRAGEGGHYSVGPITVSITKPIVFQGGYGKDQEIDGVEHQQIMYTSEDGVPLIKPVGETVPGEPLAGVTETEMNELNWPQSLRKSYERALARGAFGEGKVTEEIEAAGNDQDLINEIYLLVEEQTALTANVQIIGKNHWLETLGGNCQIGSEADPIVQHLTTGESVSPLTGETLRGTSGLLSSAFEDELVNLSGTVLVDNTYPVPAAEKCGGPAYEAYLDPMINAAFGLPAQAGASSTELVGQFDVSSVLGAINHGV
jgi:hypothetical protein